MRIEIAEWMVAISRYEYSSSKYIESSESIAAICTDAEGDSKNEKTSITIC